jgi:PAN domain-containing protein
VPSAGTSSVSSSYRIGVGTLGNTGSSDNLITVQLQTLMADRQRVVALSQAIQAAEAEHFRLEYNWDRPGGDYAQRAERTPESCRTACGGDPTCQAFTFIKPAAGAAAGQCFLKRTVPASVANPCCISEKRKSAQEEIIGNIR